MKNKNVINIGLLSVLFTITLFLRSSMAVIANDLMQEFSLAPVTLGIISSIFFWVYGILQMPVGYISDRYGVRCTVIVFGLTGIGGTVLFCLAQNIPMLSWARLMIGIGTAGVFVPAVKYASISFRPEYFARMTSLVSSVGNIGPILAAFPLALFVGAAGWRTPFAATSAFYLLLIIVAWFLLPGRTASGGVDHLGGDHAGKDSSGVKEAGKPGGGILAKYYRVIFFLVWAFFVYGILFGFQALWGCLYLQDVFSLSREEAGVILMFISIGVMIGGLFWSVLSERYLGARRPLLLTGTLVMFFSIVCLYFLKGYPGFFLLSMLYFCFGFFGSVFLINMSCVKELVPLAVTGTVVGLLNTIQILSAGFFQSLTGVYINYLQSIAEMQAVYKNVFFIYGVCILAAFFLAVFFMPETFPQEKKEHRAV